MASEINLKKKIVSYQGDTYKMTADEDLILGDVCLNSLNIPNDGSPEAMKKYKLLNKLADCLNKTKTGKIKLEAEELVVLQSAISSNKMLTIDQMGKSLELVGKTI